jgi:hypothetical protein
LKSLHQQPDMEDNLNLEIEQVFWRDMHFNEYTTLIVFGWFYTFEGEMESDEIEGVISVILENIEDAEKDGATLEMDDNVVKVMYKNVHQSNIIIN